MASNKVNVKKAKDDKGKGARGPDLQEDEDMDHAMLRKPIQTSVTGFAQARKIFDDATEEVKDLLAHECDILYECKVCRNIFRSLANFLCHKRIYCIETFNPSNHGHFVRNNSMGEELLKIQRAEEMYQESCRERQDNAGDDDEDYRIPITKDITAVLEKINQKKGIHRGLVDWQDLQLSMQKIPSSSAAVFQNAAIEDDEDHSNTMRSQVLELDKITSTNRAVLQRDGRFTTESSKRDVSDGNEDQAIAVSDEDDHDGLVCKICNRQFSTMKTLRFHMRQKHVEARLVFPCPECLDIFSTSWSVFRHLFKVHRKSAAQIRRLRESIQAKAFRMNNPPPFYERRKLNARPAPAQPITEEERLDQESQAWMESMESDGCAPRCGGCGRLFERRAALLAHTHHCLRRPRAAAHDRIQIQLRRDYPKPAAAALTPAAAASLLQHNGVEAEVNPTKVEEKKPVTEVDLSTDDNDDSNDQSTTNKDNEDASETNTSEPNKVTPGEKLRNALKALQMKQPAKKPQQPEKTKTNDNSSTDSQNTANPTPENTSKLVLTQTKRFTCKLCNFKDVYYEKLTEHLRVVHKMKGDSDFYSTTIKSSEPSDGLETEGDEAEGSPDSRRPSRCSSDSSRLSDDNVNTSNRNSRRKRKRPTMYTETKRKKDDDDISDDIKDGKLTMNNVIRAIFGQNDSTTNDSKTGDDHSSELDIEVDDIESETPPKIQEKQVKRNNAPNESSVTSVPRRPVRNRAKPKRADFEYDLSNLLKMDAQGYRESQTVTPPVVKPSPPAIKAYPAQLGKKKTQSDSQSNSSNESLRECAGALLTMSKKSEEKCAAHLRPTDMSVFNTGDQTTCKSFIRPPFPRPNRTEKASPRKQKLEINRDSAVNVNRYPQSEIKTESKNSSTDIRDGLENFNQEEENRLQDVLECKEEMEQETNINRASLEVIKPVNVSKSFAELSKGMKTKILVIKPINKNKEGSNTTANQTLKFQRIKLNPVDKSVLVKVPSISRVSLLKPSPSNGDVSESDSSEQPIETVASHDTERLVEDFQIPNNAKSGEGGDGADGHVIERLSETDMNKTPIELDEMEVVEEVVQSI